MPKLSDLEVINSVIDLFADKSKHTVDAFARDATRNSCGYSDAKAVCWCLDGAIMRVISVSAASSYAFSEQCNSITSLLFDLLSNSLLDGIIGSEITIYNDTVGYDGVMKLLHEARTVLQEREQ